MPEPTDRAAGPDGVHYRNLLVDRHPAAQLVLSPDGQVLFWSAAAERLFGYTEKEAVGRPIEQLVVPPEAPREVREHAFRQALETGCACFIGDRRHRDGARIPMQIQFDRVTRGDAVEYIIVTAREESRLARLCLAGAAPAARAALDELTPRQVEVLRLISDGWATRDIARKLHISSKTVETHRAHLMRRLRVRSVAGLVRFAVWAGVVPPEP